MPSTGGGALTHHHTHIPLSEIFSTHTHKATGCHSNLSEMVTPTTAPAITLFTNNHTEPTSSRIRDLAKTNNVGKQKKEKKKDECNVVVQDLQK